MKNKNYYNAFHSVSPSPWPLLMSISVLTSAMGLVLFMHNNMPWLMNMGLMSIIIVFTLWCMCMTSEATYQGAHTLSMVYTLKLGFFLFVLSEVMFFASFFWAYLHASLSPSPEMGVSWPPAGVNAMSPWGLPLLNSVMLMWSGSWVTVTHHSVKTGNSKQAIESLIMTMCLGLLFTMIQYYEFSWCTFSMACSVYGSSFFLITGFHGVHVIVGTIFLMVCLISLILNHFTVNSHLGLECAMFYWHFVDVMWMMVWFMMYFWAYHKM